MTAASGPPALPSDGGSLRARLTRLLHRAGSGDAVAAAFTLGGVVFMGAGLLVIALVVTLSLIYSSFFVMLASDWFFAVLIGLEALANISFCLSLLRSLRRLQPWWTRIFPAAAILSVTLFILSALLGISVVRSLPADAPLEQTIPLWHTLLAVSLTLLCLATITTLLSLLVLLVARLTQERWGRAEQVRKEAPA